MGYNTKPMIQQVRDVTPLDIKKINDNFSNLDMRINENTNNSITPITIKDMQFYNDGFVLIDTKDNDIDFSYTRDSDGKIVSITNNSTTVETNITWNNADKP